MSKFTSIDATKTKRRILSVKVIHIPDDDPDLSHLGELNRDGTFTPAMTGEETGNPNSPAEDEKRFRSYGDDWHCIGIKAFAEVVLTGSLTHVIKSGGLWGIESDSGADHFAEVANEELDGLRDELSAMGFTDDEISRAFAAVKLPK